MDAPLAGDAAGGDQRVEVRAREVGCARVPTYNLNNIGSHFSQALGKRTFTNASLSFPPSYSFDSGIWIPSSNMVRPLIGSEPGLAPPMLVERRINRAQRKSESITQ